VPDARTATACHLQPAWLLPDAPRRRHDTPSTPRPLPRAHPLLCLPHARPPEHSRRRRSPPPRPPPPPRLTDAPRSSATSSLTTSLSYTTPDASKRRPRRLLLLWVAEIASAAPLASDLLRARRSLCCNYCELTDLLPFLSYSRSCSSFVPHLRRSSPPPLPTSSVLLSSAARPSITSVLAALL